MVQVLPPPSETPVAEIIVTAARLPPAAGDAAFSFVRLSRSDIAGALRLDEALARVPAASLFRRTSSLAANPTTQGLSLRAIAPSGAGRTLVTLDGVPMNDPFGGWIIWSQLAPEAIEGIDVVRGAGAGPYGAGALTGTVALRERSAGTVVDLSGGESGAGRAAGSSTVRAGPIRLTAAALHETSDGYVPVRGPLAGAADTPLDLEASSASVRADIAAGDIAISLRAGGWREDRGAGLAGARSIAEGTVLSTTAARAPVSGAPGWRLQAWRRTSDLVNTSVAVATDRSTTTPAADQMQTPSEGWGVNAALRGLKGPSEWEVGLDARMAEGETRERFRYLSGAFTRTRIAGGRSEVAGVYAEGAWTTGPWLVAGGLRLDGWRNSDGVRLERDAVSNAVTLSETPSDRSGEVVTARLGVRRAVGRDWTVRAAAYSAFRPATLNELHRPFRVGNDITEADAGLEPERLQGADLGATFEREGLQVDITAFWTSVEDAVVNVTIGSGPGVFPRAGFVPAGGVLRQRQNAGTIDAAGLELSAAAQLSSNLSFNAAVSATDARMDGGSAAPQLTGLRPAQAPIWSATAGIVWSPAQSVDLALRARYESRRFDDDLNSRVLDAALTLDARLDFRVREAMSLWIAADNLLDEAVEASMTAGGVAGYTQPRTVRMGLTFTVQ
ncbi:TonB-dependent receptor [Rhizobium sp. CRIBSB]|nr:TonB-dependent receptor [Rhizobium sp. CRIBSB]